MRLAASLLATLLLGCAGLGGVRPYYGPVPGSVTLHFDGTPDAVTRAAAVEVQAAGLRLRFLSPEEGYLETDWYNLATREPSGQDVRDLDRAVKLRFFADPAEGKTRLVAECVVRIFYDPSRPEREAERMVPEGHQGRELLDQLLAGLRRRLGGPASPE